MFYNYRTMDVIILRNHLVLIYFWYYLEWILYFSICFLSFSFKNKLRKVWWRCGEDVVIKIFRPFIRQIYFDHSFARYISTIHTQDIFRPFIRQIYFARDLRKIFRKSVEKYFDHSFARDLRKVWWRCGEDVVIKIFRPFIRQIYFARLVKM